MFHAVLNVSRAHRLLCRQPNLADDFLRLPSLREFGGGETRPEVALFGILLVPPVQQYRKALVLRLDTPIQLRREIIYPAFVQPLARIRVKLLVGVEAFDLRGIAGTPDSKWADAEFHPRLY